MIKAEWLKIFKTRKMLVSIIAVLFIPVLYAGMFLWAFWDPYAQLSDLPVAIVNEDTGAEYEGTELALGEELSKKLKDSEQFNFISVTKEKAEKGLKNRDYYLLIEIPENFSQHATTLLDDNPSKLVIDYKSNQAYNFLGAQIGETAMDRIRAEVNAKVSETYAEKLFESITALGNGFGDAAEGASDLDEGAQKIANGTKDLKGYLTKLASSTIELSNGTEKIAQGAQTATTGANDLSSGLARLADGGNQLQAGAESASKGATTLQQGLTQYTEGVANLSNGLATLTEKQQIFAAGVNSLAEQTGSLNAAAGQLSTGASNLKAGITSLSSNLQGIIAQLPAEQAAALKQSLAQLEAGSNNLSTGLSSLAQGTGKLQAGASQLSQGANSLAEGQASAFAGAKALTGNSGALVSGATQLAAGNTTLADKLGEFNVGVQSATVGSSQLASGLKELTTGTSTLNDGTTLLATKSGELANGAGTLEEGSSKLADGTTTLAGKLKEASDTAGNVNPSEKTYEMVSQPVEVEKTAVNEVPNYGTGFSPYFISLGLFVGALLISIVFPFVEPAIRPTNAGKWYLSKVSVLAVVGIIQALITVGIVKFTLQLEVQNMGLFVLTAIITSFTFLALIQMLVSVFGDPGRFIAILVLIMQLTTSAGTFPLELIPNQLQVFHKFFPMTYTVNAFKTAISTTDTTFLFQNFGVLIGYMVVCLLITFMYFKIIMKRRYSNVAVTE